MNAGVELQEELTNVRVQETCVGGGRVAFLVVERVQHVQEALGKGDVRIEFVTDHG